MLSRLCVWKEVALMDYQEVRPGLYDFYHTETPPSKRGRGYAAKVTQVGALWSLRFALLTYTPTGGIRVGQGKQLQGYTLVLVRAGQLPRGEPTVQGIHIAVVVVAMNADYSRPACTH